MTHSESSAGAPDLLFSALVEHAIELSAQWHEGTFRKNRWRDRPFDVPVNEVLKVPVMAHVTAVALTVQRAGWDDATVAAAFLHDVIEDTNKWGEQMRRRRLRELLGDEVLARVLAVTEEKEDENGRPRDWVDRKKGYVERLGRATPEAAAISLADKLHNLWSINEALERGIDVFVSRGRRRGLTAGPDQQLWFHRTVLEATRIYEDERLIPMQARLEQELQRFEQLVGE